MQTLPPGWTRNERLHSELVWVVQLFRDKAVDAEWQDSVALGGSHPALDYRLFLGGSVAALEDGYTELPGRLKEGPRSVSNSLRLDQRIAGVGSASGMDLLLHNGPGDWYHEVTVEAAYPIIFHRRYMRVGLCLPSATGLSEVLWLGTGRVVGVKTTRDNDLLVSLRDDRLAADRELPANSFKVTAGPDGDIIEPQTQLDGEPIPLTYGHYLIGRGFVVDGGASLSGAGRRGPRVIFTDTTESWQQLASSSTLYYGSSELGPITGDGLALVNKSGNYGRLEARDNGFYNRTYTNRSDYSNLVDWSGIEFTTYSPELEHIILFLEFVVRLSYIELELNNPYGTGITNPEYAASGYDDDPLGDTSVGASFPSIPSAGGVGFDAGWGTTNVRLLWFRLPNLGFGGDARIEHDDDGDTPFWNPLVTGSPTLCGFKLLVDFDPNGAIGGSGTVYLVAGQGYLSNTNSLNEQPTQGPFWAENIVGASAAAISNWDPTDDTKEMGYAHIWSSGAAYAAGKSLLDHYYGGGQAERCFYVGLFNENGTVNAGALLNGVGLMVRCHIRFPLDSLYGGIRGYIKQAHQYWTTMASRLTTAPAIAGNLLFDALGNLGPDETSFKVAEAADAATATLGYARQITEREPAVDILNSLMEDASMVLCPADGGNPQSSGDQAGYRLTCLRALVSTVFDFTDHSAGLIPGTLEFGYTDHKLLSHSFELRYGWNPALNEYANRLVCNPSEASSGLPSDLSTLCANARDSYGLKGETTVIECPWIPAASRDLALARLEYEVRNRAQVRRASLFATTFLALHVQMGDPCGLKFSSVPTRMRTGAGASGPIYVVDTKEINSSEAEISWRLVEIIPNAS